MSKKKHTIDPYEKVLDPNIIKDLENDLKEWLNSDNADQKLIAKIYFDSDNDGKEKMIRHYIVNGSVEINEMFNRF